MGGRERQHKVEGRAELFLQITVYAKEANGIFEVIDHFIFKRGAILLLNLNANLFLLGFSISDILEFILKLH